MNKILVSILIVVVLLGLGVGLYFLNQNNNVTTGNVIANSNSDSSSGNSVLGSDISSGNEVTIILTSSHFRFYLNGVESPDLKVKQGDKVKIILNNEEGFHDWVLDEFNAKTKQVQAGVTTEVEFIADKKGTFEYYCSVGQHRANGMKGKFIVE